ncbi:RNA-directed DNA polymerase from mobile element jockey [Nephila pilipes]|uniref:RNA-directed DNA polymerase from mobile element jockey n=1 Tax=Nephila pilipes TaxID=299642 RepID=A0A8X6QZI5_NEPPI|nr:RNA-directed DNA polymerase from mobile element jockey [Nephila pilipes]
MKFSIPNYTTYRNDRPTTNNRPFGGTAILIKKPLPHYNIPTPTLNGAEATIVALTPTDGNPILITSMYIPPSVRVTHVPTDINTILNLGPTSLICGDLNAKHTTWGCTYNSSRGNALKNFADQNGIDILAPPTPTRFGHNSASTIDIALTANFDWPFQIHSLPELSSDHNPVLIHFASQEKFKLPSPKLHTNWELFRKTLLDTTINTFTLPKAHRGEDIEIEVAKLTHNILSAHQNASKPIQTNKQTFIGRELRNLFRERNKAKKLWQFTRFPADKQNLNRIQNEIRRKVHLHKQKDWEETLENLNAENGTLWKNRNFSVIINGTYSSPRNIAAGVPKGGILSPTLFNYFVNDIPKQPDTTLCVYADDTAILARHYFPKNIGQALNNHLKDLEVWYSTWKIALNVSKTEAVFFNKNNRNIEPDIYLNNNKIPWSGSTKYLGVTLDKKLTFKQHVILIKQRYKAAVSNFFSPSREKLYIK